MTPRQEQILKSIVEHYARTAEPVGSASLSSLFAVSPATLRAEMVELEKLGYIRQPHTSAGRIPTDKGYRSYVNGLSEFPTQPRVSDVIAKRVASAGEPEQAIRTAAKSLAETTHNMGLATLADQLFFTGMADLLSQPEFFGHRQALEVARLVDQLESWLQEATPTEPLSVYIGQENPIGKTSGCTLIVARFQSPYSDSSYIGVLGPTRQSYGKVMSLVGYTSKVLEETLNG